MEVSPAQDDDSAFSVVKLQSSGLQRMNSLCIVSSCRVEIPPGASIVACRQLTILLLLATHDVAAQTDAANPFEPEIRAFEHADRTHQPSDSGIVFVGSSSIKNWTNVAADFPSAPVRNRGFGGSTLAEVVHYLDRYRPRLVVLYAGDNDLALGRSPDRVAADYRALVTRLQAALPSTRLVYISIKPSPSRRAFIPAARETNRMIRAETARDSLQAFVDVFSPMLGPNGQPHPELFLADSLHMTRAGYLLWSRLLASVVR
jgi:lysophospholipase L1-like esterase